MEYMQKDFNESLTAICEKLTNNKEKGNRKSYLLGGQSGAGKTTISRKLLENDSNLIVINGDEFRRFHPHFNELYKEHGKDAVIHTQKFAGKMTEAVIDKLSNEGYSLIIEGTLRTTVVPEKTKNLLEQKGYDVELCVMQVRPEKSYLGTLERYERMVSEYEVPRHTPKEHHDLIVKNIVENLDVLYKKNSFEEIKLYNREGNVIYSQKETPDINPSAIIKNEFDRKLSKDEIKEINDGYSRVEKSMIKRNASSKEISMITELKKKINGNLSTNEKIKIKVSKTLYKNKTKDNENEK